MNVVGGVLVALLVFAGGDHDLGEEVGRALPPAISLDDAIRITERRSPLLATARSEIDVARAEEVQAKLLPDPEIDYMGFGRFSGTVDAFNAHEHQVDVGVPLLVAGQRRARMRSTRLQTHVVRAQACVVRQDVATAAALAWVELAAAQERVDAIEASRAVLEQTRLLTEERASRGAQTRLDVLKIAHEIATLDAARSSAEADLRAASGDLAVLVGAPRWTPRARGRLAELVPRTPASTSWATVQAELPEIRAAEREVQARDSDVALARRERWPVPTLRAGTFLTSNEDSASVVFGLSLPLPVFDRGRGQLARARAQARNARVRELAVRTTAKAELEASEAISRQRTKAWEILEAQALRNVDTLRQMAKDAYTGGASSVLELLDAERTILQTTLQGIEVAKAAVDADVLAQRARGTLSRDPCE